MTVFAAKTEFHDDWHAGEIVHLAFKGKIAPAEKDKRNFEVPISQGDDVFILFENSKEKVPDAHLSWKGEVRRVANPIEIELTHEANRKWTIKDMGTHSDCKYFKESRHKNRLYSLNSKQEEAFKQCFTSNLHIEQTAKLLEQDGAFDPSNSEDAREKTLRAIAIRRGQPEFRRKLLKRFNGKCVISGCAVEEVLEAAHIVPYNGEQTNHLLNGLLLRADIHTLFDKDLIEVDSDFTVQVAPSLRNSKEYGLFHGKH